MRGLLSLTLALLAGPAFALTPAQVCDTPEGDMIWTAEALQGDLIISLGSAFEGQLAGEIVVLAHCPRATQIVIGPSPSLDPFVIEAEIKGMVPSATEYAFDDVVTRMNARGHPAVITPISAELCTCLSRNS